jgi:hypothetical protein
MAITKWSIPFSGKGPRSGHRLMKKRTVAPAVKREEEEDWGKERWR